MNRHVTIGLLLAAVVAAAFLTGGIAAGGYRVAEVRREPKHIRIDEATVAAADDVMELIEPVWWTANIYDGLEAYEQSLTTFSRAQRLINAIEWYRSEVNNGGHAQFYGNSTGIVWRDALAGFEMLGLSDLAENLRESADLLGGAPPLDRRERTALLERLNPDFGEITGRFWELEDRANVDAVILDYARAHPEEFLFDGVVHVPRYEPTAMSRQMMIWLFP